MKGMVRRLPKRSRRVRGRLSNSSSLKLVCGYLPILYFEYSWFLSALLNKFQWRNKYTFFQNKFSAPPVMQPAHSQSLISVIVCDLLSFVMRASMFFSLSTHEIMLTNLIGLLWLLTIYVYIEYTGCHGAVVHIYGPSPRSDSLFQVSVNCDGAGGTDSQSAW